MDETLIRGLIIGAALGMLGLAFMLGHALMVSKGESARRLRIVLGIAVAGLVALFIASSGNDAPFLIGVVAVIVAITWVVKGKNKQ